MPKISTGNKVFDTLLEGGLESGIITTVYGPSASGKTNLAIQCAICAAQTKKVIYIDTEGGFSVERLRQLTKDRAKTLGRIIFLRPTTFAEQTKDIEKLETIVSSQIGLIVIDSIAMLYRAQSNTTKDISGTNKDLAAQINTLVRIARIHDIPILMTNHVYADPEIRGQINMVGGDIIRYSSKGLIELQKDETGRRAILRKHRHIEEKRTAAFKISEEGIINV